MQTTDLTTAQENTWILQKAESKFIALTHWSLIKIMGQLAESFLQGQFTCDLTQLDERKCFLTALCNHQGRVLAVFFLTKKADDYYCLLPDCLSTGFIEHLTKYAVFSKVLLQKQEGCYLYAAIGQAAAARLTAFYPELPTQNFEVGLVGDNQIIKLSSELPVFLMSQNVALKPEEITNLDVSWRLANILARHPILYKETKALATPHMLNLHLIENAISFNKGCYVGQEIIARTHYLGKAKKHLCKVKIASQLAISPGEIIYCNNQEAGFVVDAVLVDSLSIALAVLQEPVDRQFMVKGQPLEVIV